MGLSHTILRVEVVAHSGSADALEDAWYSLKDRVLGTMLGTGTQIGRFDKFRFYALDQN